MYKIAVLGDEASVYGFMSLGLDVFYVDTDEEAKKTLSDLAGRDYAIIYITERAAMGAKSVIDELSEGYLPAVIPIPGISGNQGLGMGGILDAVKRAVGADIL